MSIDPKKATKEDIARGLELLAKENIRKERIAKGEIKGYTKWSEMSDEQKAKSREYAKRAREAQKKKLEAYEKAVEAGLITPIV